MNCLVDEKRPCAFEASYTDSHSTDPVLDDEILCRVAYDMHFPSSSLATSFIKMDDLTKGELSVWRITRYSEFTLNDAVKLFEAWAPKKKKSPDRQALRGVYGVSAGALRNLTEDFRTCALNNTDCGDKGRHKAHAVLAVCKAISDGMTSEEASKSEPFQKIRSELRLLFEGNAVWPA